MTGPIVQTASGQIEGLIEHGVRRWLGVPYARAERFAPPLPVAPWPDVRPATVYAAQCPQQLGGKVRPEVLDSDDYCEDCLSLNVWVPNAACTSPRPVLVWIHGGAFLAGSTNPYDGAALAREGGIVVVTIAYRLGVLGWVNFGEALGLPMIPSNLGLRDQIAALEWVRDNIAAFGGDPGRVTLGGQSAGSLAVSLLMLCRRAWPLFHGALLQSGAQSLIHERDRSLEDARAFARELDLDQGALERLTTMPVSELLAAQAAIGKAMASGIPAAPWFDGDLLPASLDAAMRAPLAPVPVMAGATAEEIRLFDLLPGHILPSRWDELETLLRLQLPGEQAARIVAAYPRTKQGRRALASDLSFAMPTRNFAERQATQNAESRQARVWYYRFDYSHPIAGPTHGLDLLLFWPFAGFKMAFFRGGANRGKRKALGERMRIDVARFVAEGDPGGGWPEYTVPTRAVKVYDLADRIEHNPDAVRFAAWGGHDVSPGKARG